MGHIFCLDIPFQAEMVFPVIVPLCPHRMRIRQERQCTYPRCGIFAECDSVCNMVDDVPNAAQVSSNRNDWRFNLASFVRQGEAKREGIEWRMADGRRSTIRFVYRIVYIQKMTLVEVTTMPYGI